MTEPAIDTGAILEALNDKTDRDCRNVDTTAGADAVIEWQAPTAANNYTWYRLYKSGWVEQGGRLSINGQISSTNKRITFPIKMESSTYYANASQDANVAIPTYVGWQSTTQMSIGVASGSSSGTTTWEVKGLAAQS